MKPGWTTTEFYVTLATTILPLVTLLFHKDFSSYVPAIAAAAAAVASVGYAISRAIVKHGHAVATKPAPATPTP